MKRVVSNKPKWTNELVEKYADYKTYCVMAGQEPWCQLEWIKAHLNICLAREMNTFDILLVEIEGKRLSYAYNDKSEVFFTSLGQKVVKTGFNGLKAVRREFSGLGAVMYCTNSFEEMFNFLTEVSE